MCLQVDGDQRVLDTPSAQDVVGLTPAFGNDRRTTTCVVVPVHRPPPPPPHHHLLHYLASLPRPVNLFRFKGLHWLQTAAPLPETLLSNIAPLTLCALPLNRNPANPTSNGVYWERYQTRPLGLDLWPSCRREKGRIQHHLLRTHRGSSFFFTPLEPAEGGQSTGFFFLTKPKWNNVMKM